MTRFTDRPAKFELLLDSEGNGDVIRVVENKNGGDIDLIISEPTQHPDIRRERRLVLARESAAALAEVLLNPPAHR